MTVTVPYGKDLTLPDVVRDRLGLSPDTPVRMIETRDGLLLIPLTGESMPQDLLTEIADWQNLRSDTLADFPYDDEEQAAS